MSSGSSLAPADFDASDAGVETVNHAELPDISRVAPNSLKSLLLPDPVTAAVVTVITVLTYLPTLLATYGISDDYFDLLLSTRDNRSLPNVAIAGGRPVSGLLQEFTLSLATDVGSLRWLRLLGVLGIAATAVVGSAIIRSLGAGKAVQVLTGLGIAAMPSSQVIASWAVLFPVSWGTALALAAGFSLRALRVESFRQREWWLAAGLVAVVTTIGLANYQPSAMAFAPGFVLALIDSAESLTLRARRAAAGIVGAVGGGLAYLVLSSILVKWTGVTVDTRSSLELPGADKLNWFVVEVVPRSLDPISFQPRTVVAVVVAVLVLIGLASTARTWSDRLIVVALATSAVFFAYLPTLMVIDQWPSARSRLSIDITVSLFFGVAVHAAIVKARPYPILQRSILVSWGAIIALFTVFASWRVTAYYVNPQVTEYAVVSKAIADLHLQPGATVVVIAADWQLPLAPDVDLDEFGFPSMATSWGPVALIQLEMMHDGFAPLTDITVVTDVSQVPSTAQIVLDIRVLFDTLR